MSIIIGRPRSVSLSCLVRSSIEMPMELEKKIKNLDDVYIEQVTKFNESVAFVKTALKHDSMGEWQHISRIYETCEDRMRLIRVDYVRATSYESMRIINTRMTDVLNAITPVKNFMEFAIKRCEEGEEGEGQKKEKARDKDKRGGRTVRGETSGRGNAQVLKHSGGLILDVFALENTKAGEAETDPDTARKGTQANVLDQIVKESEETDLLLNENHNKPNVYEEEPRRRSRLFGCFGL